VRWFGDGHELLVKLTQVELQLRIVAAQLFNLPRAGEWSLLNFFPISGSDDVVSVRTRYMATCRAWATGFMRRSPRRSSTFSS